jgi:predicted nucleotidyltransferase
MTPSEAVSIARPVFAGTPSVRLAYLFGSAARDDMHPRSDFDFAVLLDDGSIDAYCRLWADLREALGTSRLDLALLDHADPVLGFEVIREGRLVHARSAEDLNAFERRAWHRYQDTRRLRAIGDAYLKARAEAWFSSRKQSANV